MVIWEHCNCASVGLNEECRISCNRGDIQAIRCGAHWPEFTTLPLLPSARFGWNRRRWNLRIGWSYVVRWSSCQWGILHSTASWTLQKPKVNLGSHRELWSPLGKFWLGLNPYCTTTDTLGRYLMLIKVTRDNDWSIFMDLSAEDRIESWIRWTIQSSVAFSQFGANTKQFNEMVSSRA